MKNKKNLLCALILAGLLSCASMVGCGEDIESNDTPDESIVSGSEIESEIGGAESESENSSVEQHVHASYDEIEGEPTSVVAPIVEGSVKGYSVKKCSCGEEIKGDYTVIVTVKLNGADPVAQTVKVGAGLTLTLPTRDGYTLKLYENGAEFDLTKAFNDFATVELTSRWFFTETNYDYLTDAEAKVASLPAEANAENAEAILKQIAAIEAIVNTHYTEEEKVGAVSLAELKAAAEAIVNTADYQLNKRLNAIPEIEDMTNEGEALLAVWDYISYYEKVKAELEDYNEPRKVSIYKSYFSGRNIAITDIASKMETNASHEEHNLVMTGAEDNAYTFKMPKMPYALFTEAYMITVFGQANSAYTFNAYGATFANTSVAWNWFKVLRVGAEGKTVKNTETGDDIVLGEGYYLTIGNTDVGAEWYTYVKLPEAVVNGEEGLTFTVTTSEGNWDWMQCRQDGSVAACNFVCSLLEIQSGVGVHRVTYSYRDGEGEKELTQYYLNGEELSLPELSVSYTDKVGTHTFIGWGETADVVTGDLTYTATYETQYKNYTVTFLDSKYDVFEEKDDYRYGDKVVLPTTNPEKAKEGDWEYEFIGWFDGENEVTSETKVEKNVEIIPQFRPIYAGACYVLTIESADLEAQTFNIPVMVDYQAEALSLIPALEREGYSFAGYTNKDTAEAVDLATLVLSADTTIVANWTPKYIVMAEALPASASDITDEDQTYEDLVAYLSYVTTVFVEGYEEPANVTALKLHYIKARKIYTFTSTSDENITTSARFEKVEGKTDSWYIDDRGNAYGGFIQVTFDAVDGNGYVIMPKINYAIYGEVSFAIFGLGAENAVQVAINGKGATLDNTGAIYYVVEIHGKNLEVHNMNGVNTLFTATLTDAQYNGVEGLRIDVIENGWSCVQISHILGHLEQDVVTPEEVMTAEKLLAKLPASAEDITDEEQTYDDLVKYLSLVANNPVDGYEEPAKISALKVHYAATRKIHIYNSTTDMSVSGALTMSVGTKTDSWYQDDQEVKYGGYANMTFDQADGEYAITLPNINFGIYSEVSFGLYTGIAGSLSIAINGKECSAFVSDGFYVVEINGRILNIHKMNSASEVLFTVTLTNAQYNGTEGLVMTVNESGWNSVQISHILGTLSMGSAEGPSTPDASDAVAISGVAAKTTSSAKLEGKNLVMTGATDNTYSFTLAEVKFCDYTEVAMIATFGMANSAYTFNAYGVTFANISKAWNWFKVVKVGTEGKTVKNPQTGDDIVLKEGYYLTIGNTDIGSEWYTYVKLPETVINGEEGLTFIVTTAEGAWDYLAFRQDGSVEDDNFVGVLA